MSIRNKKDSIFIQRKPMRRGSMLRFCNVSVWQKLGTDRL